MESTNDATQMIVTMITIAFASPVLITLFNFPALTRGSRKVVHTVILGEQVTEDETHDDEDGTEEQQDGQDPDVCAPAPVINETHSNLTGGWQRRGSGARSRHGSVSAPAV